MNAWGSWSACSPNNGKCGAGTQYQTRTVATQPYCSPACPATRQTRSCTHSCCPRDCAVSSWGSWSACSNTCGTGESYEVFFCTDISWSWWRPLFRHYRRLSIGLSLWVQGRSKGQKENCWKGALSLYPLPLSLLIHTLKLQPWPVWSSFPPGWPTGSFIQA